MEASAAAIITRFPPSPDEIPAATPPPDIRNKRKREHILAAPDILSLGKSQIYLLFRSLIRIFV